jgi:glycosyltransferase involved in cell wall biosynthesis
MTISIITATFNSATTLRDTLDSVAGQDHPSVEHIIVDGKSTDSTVDIIKSYLHVANWVSETDRGLYDAINKGIGMSKGDVVGILNSDDFYPRNTVLSDIARAFEDPEVDAIIGDIAFVRPENLDKVIRHYSSARFHPRKFAAGYMPAHPSFYVRKKYYDAYGLYKLDYKIAADYELLMRFMHTHGIRFKYLPEILVYMRTGGVSNATPMSRYVLNQEIVRACAENGVRTSMARLSLKYFNKIFEYIKPMVKPVTGAAKHMKDEVKKSEG